MVLVTFDSEKPRIVNIRGTKTLQDVREAPRVWLSDAQPYCCGSEPWNGGTPYPMMAPRLGPSRSNSVSNIGTFPGNVVDLNHLLWSDGVAGGMRLANHGGTRRQSGWQHAENGLPGAHRPSSLHQKSLTPNPTARATACNPLVSTTRKAEMVLCPSFAHPIVS